MAKCNIEDQRAAKDSKDVANNLIENFETVYYQNFGIPLFNKKALENTSKRLTSEINSKRKRLKYLKSQGPSKELNVINDEIISLGRERKKYDYDYKNFSKKKRALKKIHDTILNRLIEYAESRVYDVNPYVQIPVIKSWISKQYSVPFDRLTDLDAGVLTSIGVKLDKAFAKADAIAKGDRRLNRSGLEDPATSLLASDPSLLGYKFIQSTESMTDNAYSNAAIHKRALTNALDQLNNYAKTKNATGTKVDVESLIQSVHKKLDRQEMYLKPMRVVGWDKTDKSDKPGYRFENIMDKNKYEEILLFNIKNGWNEGGQIQRIEIDGRNHYYIAIKQAPEIGGKEVYHAYEVPYVPAGMDVKGKKIKRDRLIMPMNKNNAKEWIAFFSTERLAPTYGEYDKENMMGGVMQEGWYKANNNAPMNGKNAKGKEITLRAYSDYRMMDNQDGLSEPEWLLLSEIRRVLKSVYGDLSSKILAQQSLLTEAVHKMARKEGLSIDQFKEKGSLNDIVADVLGVDGLNMNFYINEDGKVISMNHFFNYIEDYVPYRFSITDMLLNSIEYKDALEVRIDEAERGLASFVDKNQDNMVQVGQEIIDRKVDIQELRDALLIMNDKINMTVGVLKPENIDHANINQATKLKATMERGLMMEPLPRYVNDKGDITFAEFTVNKKGEKKPNKKFSEGRRLDFNVFTNYIDEAYKQLEQNSVKIELLNAVQGVDQPTRDFIVDHFKASIGNLDVDAGLFSVDYSDAAFAKLITPMYKKFYGSDFEVTPDMVHRFGRLHSKLISASLLGWSSALNNNAQRLSGAIEHGFGNYWTAMKFVKENPTQAQAIADAMGVTDTLTAMADALSGSVGGDISPLSGAINIKDRVLLTLDKHDFVGKAYISESWDIWISRMIENHDPEKRHDANTLAKLKRKALEGYWDATTGVKRAAEAKGGIDKLTKKQIKSLTSELHYIMGNDQVNKYVGWALSGAILTGTSGDVLFGFQQSELRMRVETAVLGAMMALESGIIPESHVSKFASDPMQLYTHPNAIAYGRTLVYNTLFGLSPAFLPKAFRGFWGQMLFKFKPYTWHQMRNEMRTMSNWFDSIEGSENVMEKALEATLNPQSKVEEKARRFFLSRGLISLFSSFLQFMPIVGPVVKTLKYQTINRALSGSLERGGSSVVLGLGFNMLAKSIYITGLIEDDEEDEKLNEILLRFFAPMAVTSMVDAYNDGDIDYLRPLQLYQRGLFTAYDTITDLFD